MSKYFNYSLTGCPHHTQYPNRPSPGPVRNGARLSHDTGTNEPFYQRLTTRVIDTARNWASQLCITTAARGAFVFEAETDDLKLWFHLAFRSGAFRSTVIRKTGFLWEIFNSFAAKRTTDCGVPVKERGGKKEREKKKGQGGRTNKLQGLVATHSDRYPFFCCFCSLLNQVGWVRVRPSRWNVSLPVLLFGLFSSLAPCRLKCL